MMQANISTASHIATCLAQICHQELFSILTDQGDSSIGLPLNEPAANDLDNSIGR